MNYAEAAYFDGVPCQHVADYQLDKWTADRRKRVVLRTIGATERRKMYRTN